MLELLRQVSFLIAALRLTAQEIIHENEELRKRYLILLNEYDKLKNEYDKCKRNLEKTSQETTSNGA